MWTRYKKLIEMRFGFNENNYVYSLKEVGEEFGVSRQRVQHMEVYILRHIKIHLLKEKYYE